MPIEAIVPRRLYQQVADQLRELIESGEYAVGDRLPTERELAERMGISRPTIREALIALEVQGHVRIRVGSGIYVTASRADENSTENGEGPFELLRARGFIEAAIAAEAARRVDAGHLERLDDVLRRMETSRHPSDEVVDLDREFHMAVAEILGNAVLVRVVRELFDERMNPYFRRLSSYFENRDSWDAAWKEHGEVRDAIAAHDPERAKAAMERHLSRSQSRFSRNFGEKTAVKEVAEE
ncbi:FadR/GntR family transcriptional regulator [Chelativorans sp. AA-79]|uniref:FadR/GntR family transcriptional regulator n=1 Tax=Chelativorans sp. AA-79 TaxID=3028735 RepID=UPI0023F95E9E|nr:FadR/GntR family transcriptional regulator [Chelativorans sp. AA-79]WEX08350.1 FadR/GntR family transcriptional regulator [Chelativorans sp. AA-79]